MSHPAKPLKPMKKSSALDLIGEKKWITTEEHYMAKQAFVEELTLFYRDHCPEKVGGVEHAASVIYKNDEFSLVKDLCKKYHVEPKALQQITLTAAAKKVRDAYERYTSSNPMKAVPLHPVSAAAEEPPPPPPPPRRASTIPIPEADACAAPATSDISHSQSPPPVPMSRPNSGNFRVTHDQSNASAYFTEANVAHMSDTPPRSPPPRAPPRPPGAEKAAAREEESEVDGDGEDFRASVHAFDSTSSKEKEEPIIREGMLIKLRSKDGEPEKHRFILRASSLIYIKSKSGQFGSRAKNGAQQLLSGLTGYSFGTDKLEEELTRSIHLLEVLVLPLSNGARGGASVGGAAGVPNHRASITSTNVVADVPEDHKTFRLFTRDKSFFVRAESRIDRDAWFHEINAAASALQMAKIGRTVSEAEVCPIRVIASTMPACQICLTNFGFTGRRHHCRACGACVCDQCSRDKVRIPSLHANALFKVCNLCARELKAARRYGANRADDL